MTLPDPSTPYLEALTAMLKGGLLDKAEHAALSTPIPRAVWTFGDLPVVVGRGEIKDTALAGKLAKVLGAEAPKAETGALPK